MNKAFAYVLLAFFILVAANFVATDLSHISFAPLGTPPIVNADANELGAVNFSLFDKNGIGRSYITQGYGDTPWAYLYVGHWHNGIDIAAAYGAPIYSPNAGTVLATGNQDNYCYHLGFGKFVAVKDPVNNLVLWYAHLGTVIVAPGETIASGSEIGTVGNTGFETGTHLHFSIFKGTGFTMQARNGCGPDATGKDIDPLDYLGTTYK